MTLAHLTINTNNLRMSPRAEVSAQAIAALAPFVCTCPPTPIPGLPHLRADCRRKMQGRAVLTIWHSPRASVAMAVLCWEQQAADETWPALVNGGRNEGITPAMLRCPESLPWLAVVLTPNAAQLSPEDLAALADLERCWAWAVLDKEGSQ